MLKVADSNITIQPEKPVTFEHTVIAGQNENIDIPKELWAASELAKIRESKSTSPRPREAVAPDAAQNRTPKYEQEKSTFTSPTTKEQKNYDENEAEVEKAKKTPAQIRYERNATRRISHDDALKGRGYLSRKEYEQNLKSGKIKLHGFSRVGRDYLDTYQKMLTFPKSELKATPNYNYVQPRPTTSTLPENNAKKDGSPGHRFGEFTKEQKTLDYQDYMTNHKSISVKQPSKQSAALVSPNRDYIKSTLDERTKTETELMLTTMRKTAQSAKRKEELINEMYGRDNIEYDVTAQKYASHTRATVHSEGSLRSPLKVAIQPEKRQEHINPVTDMDINYQQKVVEMNAHQAALTQFAEEAKNEVANSPWSQWTLPERESKQVKQNKLDSNQQTIKQKYAQNAQTNKVIAEEQKIKEEMLKEEQKYEKSPNYFPNQGKVDFQTIETEDHRPKFNASPNKYKNVNLLKENNCLNFNQQKPLDTHKLAQYRVQNKRNLTENTENTISNEYVAQMQQVQERNKEILDTKHENYENYEMIEEENMLKAKSRQSPVRQVFVPPTRPQTQKTASPERSLNLKNCNFDKEISREHGDQLKAKVDKDIEDAQMKREKEENQLQQVFKYPNGAEVHKEVASKLLDKLANKVAFAQEDDEMVAYVKNDAEAFYQSPNDLKKNRANAHIDFAKQNGRNDQKGLLQTEWAKRNRDDFLKHKYEEKMGLQKEEELTKEQKQREFEQNEFKQKEQFSRLSTARRSPISDFGAATSREKLQSRATVEAMTNINVPVCTMLLVDQETGKLKMNPANQNNFDYFDQIDTVQQYKQNKSPQRVPHDINYNVAPVASKVISAAAKPDSIDRMYNLDTDGIKQNTQPRTGTQIVEFGKEADRQTMEECNKINIETQHKANDFVYAPKYNQVNNKETWAVNFGFEKGRD